MHLHQLASSTQSNTFKNLVQLCIRASPEYVRAADARDYKRAMDARIARIEKTIKKVARGHVSRRRATPSDADGLARTAVTKVSRNSAPLQLPESVENEYGSLFILLLPKYEVSGDAASFVIATIKVGEERWVSSKELFAQKKEAGYDTVLGFTGKVDNFTRWLTTGSYKTKKLREIMIDLREKELAESGISASSLKALVCHGLEMNSYVYQTTFIGVSGIIKSENQLDADGSKWAPAKTGELAGQFDDVSED